MPTLEALALRGAGVARSAVAAGTVVCSDEATALGRVEAAGRWSIVGVETTGVSLAYALIKA
jgi:hypothetical protein